MVRLAWVKTLRAAFGWGLLVGLAVYGPQLAFFWGIFGVAAIALWLILAIWVGIFILLARWCLGNFGRLAAILLMPALWTGLEYFRGELYYLRFSWLTPGFAFSDVGTFQWVGVYGVGFLLMGIVAVMHLMPRRVGVVVALASLVGIAGLENCLRLRNTANADGNGPLVVAIQMEYPGEGQALNKLDEALNKYPGADLFVLSEYTFGDAPPERICNWCREKHRYLIAGGIDWIDRDRQVFRDTAFVVGPDGQVLFSQGKSVPVQFFRMACRRKGSTYGNRLGARSEFASATT